MKKATETKASKTQVTNSISVSGIVTFCKALKTKAGEVWGYNVGVKVPYIGNNGSEFNAFPCFLVPFTDQGEPEKGDVVNITAHFETHKYNDKLQTSFVADSIS